ncbi:MAG TPA: toll/interleukin-1 receptor domain-containing protein [Chitinophagaceae bacterium]|nr:toll/interleukin-1 receptor domain-containing protein [Chitinophagaceae bacterium]
MAKPITIFISYAHKDSSYLEELQTFLKPLIREKRIAVWTDKNIVAGQKWNEIIRKKLNKSEVILFLVSPDFLASDYINDTEIQDSLKREDLTIIPVIVRPIVMDLLKIKYLQAIPTGAKAISDWDKRDNAWNDVISALTIVFNDINVRRPKDSFDDEEETSTNPTAQNFTDKLMKWLLALLVTFSVGVFIYGLIKVSGFHVSTSLAGICIGVAGHRFSRKSSTLRLSL